MAYYERNLPHWHPDGVALFLTWCLHGAVERHRARKRAADPGKAFAELDRVLDKGSDGPTWLRDCRIAERNPVRAGLAATIAGWPWSSAARATQA